jgi:DNA-binding MarR family transcriptional regulator
MSLHDFSPNGILRVMNDEVLVSAWHDVLAKHAQVMCALERELGEKHGLGPSEFEVLDHIVALECRKFRVQELADAVHLSQSALSRVVARLEKSGLVSRGVCDADRRGVYVHITEDGRQRHTAALPTHRSVLSHVFAAV